MFLEDRDFAYDEKKPSAAVSASMGLARVNGLINSKPTVQVNMSFGSLLKEVEERREMKDVTPNRKTSAETLKITQGRF